jgi:hypothetical protein
MTQALCDHLLEMTGLYVDEMVIFLLDEFRVQVTNSSLKRAFASVSWSKKVTRQRAKEQNADLRDFYGHNEISGRKSHGIQRVGVRPSQYLDVGGSVGPTTGRRRGGHVRQSARPGVT